MTKKVNFFLVVSLFFVIITLFIIHCFSGNKEVEITLMSGVEKQFPIELTLNNKMIYKGFVSKSEVIYEKINIKTKKIKNKIHVIDLHCNKEYSYEFISLWDRYIYIVFYKELLNNNKVVTFESSYLEQFPL